MIQIQDLKMLHPVSKLQLNHGIDAGCPIRYRVRRGVIYSIGYILGLLGVSK